MVGSSNPAKKCPHGHKADAKDAQPSAQAQEKPSTMSSDAHKAGPTNPTTCFTSATRATHGFMRTPPKP